MSYYGTTPGILLPGFLPNYAAMPPTQQGPYPMYPFPVPQLPPPPPQLGFPQDTAMKLVERVLKELQGIRAGQETGFQNVETGIQNEFQALQQSLTKRGADGEPGISEPNKKLCVGNKNEESDLDDSVASPTNDPSFVVQESGTICGQYQVSEILQFTRVKGETQGNWRVLSANGTIQIRFIREHSTGLARLEHLVDSERVYLGYLKYHTPHGAVGAEKRVARLFEGHGGLEAGELVEGTDSSLVISSVKVNSRVELSKYSFRYKFVRPSDMNELLGMTKSSFIDDE